MWGKQFLRRFYSSFGLLSRLRWWVVLLVALLLGGSLRILFGVALRVQTARDTQMLALYVSRLGALVEARGGDVAQLDSAGLLRRMFSTPVLGTTCYPMLIRPTGQLEYHFYRAGQYIGQEALEAMARSKDRQGTIRYTYQRQPQREVLLTYDYLPELGVYVAVERDPHELTEGRLLLAHTMWLLFLGGVLLTFVLASVQLRGATHFVNALESRLSSLARGEHPESMPEGRTPMTLGLSRAVNTLINWLTRTTEFTQAIGEKELDAAYEPLGEQDALGQALLAMRERLREQQQETARQKSEESIRNWTNSSLADFSKTLREHGSNMEELSMAVLQQLVHHLGAVEGGFYISRRSPTGEEVLSLSAAFAYGRQKFLSQEIKLGEGLVGTCAQERQYIYMTEIPADYCTITSGIGETPPRALLLLPLKNEEHLYGVIELASLRAFAPHEIAFAQMLSESIAMTLMSTQSTQRMAELFKESQLQREQVREQEEQMRQNLEEMRATQEEMERKTEKVAQLEGAVNECFLYGELDGNLRIVRANSRCADLEQSWGVPLRPGALLSEVLTMAYGQLDGAKHLQEVSRQLDQGSHCVMQFSLERAQIRLVVQLSLSVGHREGEHYAGVYFVGAYFDGATSKEGQ